MSLGIPILKTSDPEVALQQCLEAFGSLAFGSLACEKGEDESDAFAFTFMAKQDYLPGAPTQELLAVGALRRASNGSQIVGLSIAEPNAILLDAINHLDSNWQSVEQWCHRHQMIWLDLSQPLQLKPVNIPKPWGQEIWYTGIEERGQSRVVDERGREIPLPWLLSVCPRHLLGLNHSQLILLKVLDPLPEVVFGDLYFEMHEEKREVYVVTHVDETAWPDGQGGIRFGFDQNKRKQLGSDAEFKRQYLAAVEAYREVRLQIDELLDRRRREHGVALDAPVAPAMLKTWLAESPKDLQALEAERRAAMEAFIYIDPLQLGDVVKVPRFTPHSLLHGVRTVEFQTPVYERKILSFAQKVLTQSYWDTEEAMELVSLEAPEPADLPLVFADADRRVEEVVDFDDFRVERITLATGAGYDIVSGQDYALLMAVTGGIALNNRLLKAEEAVLLAAGDRLHRLDFNAEGSGVVLLARPKLQSAV